MTAAGHIIGTHPVDNGGIDMAVRRAAAAGMSGVQLFTAIPKFYGDRSSIRAERVQRFQAALQETGIRPEHVLVHGAYVLNPVSDERDKWERSAAALVKEMERSTTLGVGAVCFHSGSSSRALTSSLPPGSWMARKRRWPSMESESGMRRSHGCLAPSRSPWLPKGWPTLESTTL